ncbi:MAG: putative ABC transporter ATP-binding protein [Candidatus Hydrogenedentota bacterium]
MGELAVNGACVVLDGVTFGYGPNRPVLRSLDLTLRAGERVGLIGANGSGKTTLLHLLVGLRKPSAGRITCFGTPRTTESDFRDLRKRAGLLFQDSDDQLFCPTVGEDVMFGPLNLGKTHAEARAIASETLRRIGLANYESRVTYRLSGGEKRLVALATVLAMQPDVLLLDEPLTGLDEEHETRITEILLDLPQAMLIVSHNREFLARVAQRTYVLRNGSLEE